MMAWYDGELEPLEDQLEDIYEHLIYERSSGQDLRGVCQRFWLNRQIIRLWKGKMAGVAEAEARRARLANEEE